MTELARNALRSPARPKYLAAYGSIAAPLAILIVPLYNYLPSFYASEIGLSMSAIGLIFFASRLWDGILDPVIGILSDRTRSRWGARKPWIAVGAVVLIATSYLVCVPPAGAGYGYLTATLFLLYVAWTCVQIPHLAWGAELADDYLGRSHVVAVRETFFMLGILSAVVLPVLLFGTAELDLRKVMFLYAVLVAVLLPITTGCAIYFTPAVSVSNANSGLLWTDALTILKGRSAFRRICASYFLMQLGLTVYDSVVLFLVTKVLALPQYFLLLATLQFVVTIVSMPLIARLGKRWDKHVLLAGFTVLFPTGCAVLALAPVGGIAVPIVAYILIGVSVAPYRIMPTSMAADCAELDFRESGTDRTATHMAVVTFFAKLALACGVGLAFPLLDVIGFSGKGQNSDAAQYGLRALVLVIPAVFMMASLFTLRRYPLNRGTLAAIRASGPVVGGRQT